MSKMNEKAWNSSNHGKKHSKSQHKKKKKYFVTDAPKRTKKRFNKKKGEKEVSKKGSVDRFYWAD